MRSITTCVAAAQDISGRIAFLHVVWAAGHLWIALAYVERNPVRAGMVASARDYRWSSATAHMTGTDEHELIDMRWWKTNAATAECAQFLGREDAVVTAQLRASTYAGRPFGDEVFVTEVGTRARCGRM